MEQLITVATFNERAPAELLLGRLLEAGFHADLQDESDEQRWKLFNLTPRAHLRVRVDSSEEERALAQLGAWKEEGILAAAVQCPECGSSRVEFPQFSRKTIVGALPAALAAAGMIEQDYFCEACKFTWPATPPEAEPERDSLNWPVR